MSDQWPPEDGKEFIRSDEFGNMVLKWCEELAVRYTKMEFTDAASHVYTWFDGKLKINRRFINSRRFRTKAAFVDYLRQCVWNAARLAARQRSSRERNIVEVPQQEAINKELSPDQLTPVFDAIDRLDFVKKTIVESIFFHDKSPELVADSLQISVDDVYLLYEEAIDELGNVIDLDNDDS